jgi:hypothetical protein
MLATLSLLPVEARLRRVFLDADDSGLDERTYREDDPAERDVAELGLYGIAADSAPPAQRRT